MFSKLICLIWYMLIATLQLGVLSYCLKLDCFDCFLNYIYRNKTIIYFKVNKNSKKKYKLKNNTDNLKNSQHGYRRKAYYQQITKRNKERENDWNIHLYYLLFIFIILILPLHQLWHYNLWYTPGPPLQG